MTTENKDKLNAADVFKEVLNDLGFANHKPSQMTNSDYWLCTCTAMERFAQRQSQKPDMAELREEFLAQGIFNKEANDVFTWFTERLQPESDAVEFTPSNRTKERRLRMESKGIETILDKHYHPGMHWKSVNRYYVLQAMQEYSDLTTASLRTELSESRARIVEWVSVEERLPEKADYVLVSYLPFPASTKSIVCTAFYTKGDEVEFEDFDYQGDVTEKEKEMEQLFLKPGWYEEQEQYGGEYDTIFAKRNVTHWQPLPSPPTK